MLQTRFSELLNIEAPVQLAGMPGVCTVELATAVANVRVLEIPTPRWTTFDAVRNNKPLLENVPATVQERAWTSPIWYTPKG